MKEPDEHPDERTDFPADSGRPDRRSRGDLSDQPQFELSIPQEPPDKQTGNTLADAVRPKLNWKALAIGLILFSSYKAYQAGQDSRRAPQNDRLRGRRIEPSFPIPTLDRLTGQTADFDKRGKESEALWKVAVAALHQFRFETPSESNEPSNVYYQRRYDGFRAALQQARQAPQSGVDRDLISMVERHFLHDDRELQLVRSYLDYAERHQFATNTQPVKDNERRASMFLSELTEEQFSQLPEAIQQILAELLELLDKKYDQLREIEVMQARLEERYRGRKFLLPKLREGD